MKKWGDGASMIRKPWKRRVDNEGMEVEGSDGSEDDEDGPLENATTQSVETVNKPHVRREQTGQHDDLDALANSMDSLSLVPPTIRFGRGGKRKTLVQSATYTNTQKNNTRGAELR